MLLKLITLSSPLTKVMELLGSIKIMCHRVLWVKCMLLRKAFLLSFCLETFSIYISVSACLSLFQSYQMHFSHFFILQGSHSLCSNLYFTIFWQLSTSPWLWGNPGMLYPKWRLLGAEGGGRVASHSFIISCPQIQSQRLKIISKCTLQPISSLHGY